MVLNEDLGKHPMDMFADPDGLSPWAVEQVLHIEAMRAIMILNKELPPGSIIGIRAVHYMIKCTT